jgi:hypothetical protein
MVVFLKWNYGYKIFKALSKRQKKMKVWFPDAEMIEKKEENETRFRSTPAERYPKVSTMEYRICIVLYSRLVSGPRFKCSIVTLILKKVISNSYLAMFFSTFDYFFSKRKLLFGKNVQIF